MEHLYSTDLATFEEFSRGIISAYTEDQLIKITANTLKAIFGDYYYCIRLFSPIEDRITSTIAEGPVVHSELSVIRIKKSTATKTGIYREEGISRLVEFTGGYHKIFRDTSDGTGTPVVFNGSLLGIINLESPSGNLIPRDKLLMILFANQLAISVNNIRLLNRTEMYRGFLYGIIDNAGVLISVVDSEGKIVLVNRFFKERVEMEFGDIIGQPVMGFFPASERLRLHRAFLRLKEGDSEHVNLNIFFRDKKRQIDMNMTLSPLKDRDGELQYIVAIGVDMTDFLSLKSQYEDSKKMATIGEFVSQISHELNNPITSIKVYAEYIRKRLASGSFSEADIGEKIERIETTIDRLHYFVKSIVSYAKPFSEKKEHIRLASILNQSLYFCQYLIEKKGIETVMSVEEGIFLNCFPNQLQQAIINLITNGIQAMQEGGRLTIDARQDGKYIIISISDTGVGMSEEQRKKIFEPFFSTRKSDGGVGLGLTIVRNAVLAHSGRIEVESEEGRGTTFRIILSDE